MKAYEYGPVFCSCSNTREKKGNVKSQQLIYCKCVCGI